MTARDAAGSFEYDSFTILKNEATATTFETRKMKARFPAGAPEKILMAI